MRDVLTKSDKRKVVVGIAVLILCIASTAWWMFAAHDKFQTADVSQAQWYKELDLSPQEAELLSGRILRDGLKGSARRIHDRTLDSMFPNVQFIEVLSVSTDKTPPLSSTYGIPFRGWLAYDVKSKVVVVGARWGWGIEELFGNCDVRLASKEDANRLASAFDAFLNGLGGFGGCSKVWEDGPHEKQPDGTWMLRSDVFSDTQIICTVDANLVVKDVVYDQGLRGREKTIKDFRPHLGSE